MRPLLFLTYRSFVNGLRRALTSPKRLITTLVILLYYFWYFVRPLFYTNGFQGRSVGFARIEFPSLELIGAIVFIIFAGVSLLLTMGIFGYRASFKPADVDVLFPTPVSPRVVLLFRIVRDYLGTLIVPLLFIALTWKPLGFSTLFKNVPHPESAGYALRALGLGFILLTMCWVGLGYALSLYVNRNDARSDLRKKIVGWSIAIPCFLVVAYAVRMATQFENMSQFVAFAQQKWLHAFFFTATPAAWIVMGPLDGSAAETLTGAGILTGIAAIGLYLALRQAEWMYDQAAVRGFGSETIRQLQRKGDLMGVMAEAARRGKLRAKRPGWFQRMNVPGFRALLWKDVLIQWRTIRAMILIFCLIGLMFVAMPYLSGMRSRGPGIGYVILMMNGFVAFMVATITSQSGFTELLRRVDLQKPLPFTPQTIVLSEIASKAIPSIVVPGVLSLAALVLFPSAWSQVLAGGVFFSTLGVVICALVCVIVLLFPEVDDPSQRGFRGLMTMLGMIIVGTPGALVALGVGMLTQSPVIGAIPGALVNLGVAIGLSFVGGALYTGFNPSE